MFDFLRRTVRPTPDRKFVFVPKLEGFEERMNPVVVANPETYAVNKASVLSVGVSNGILANDFDTADSGAVLNAAIGRYQGRISGPLLDRIDLVIDVPRPEIRIPTSHHDWRTTAGESSGCVRKRVAAAIRFGEGRGRGANVWGMSGLELDSAAATTLESAARSQGLSLRAVHRTARVARTIADLSQSRTVPVAAVQEALMFRAGAALTSLKGA